MNFLASNNNNATKYNWVDIGRSVAILLVMMIHTGQLFASELFLSASESFSSRIIFSGDLGVELFFILSAFTLFNSYSKRYDADGKNRNLFFFIRRLFRIAPLYTLSAIFYTAVEIFTKGFHAVQYWKVLVSIIYLNGIILPAISYIPPGGWSIGTEMLFYLLIPLLFIKVDSLKKAGYLLLFSIILSNVINFVDQSLVEHFTTRNYESMRSWQLYFWLPNQFPVFAFGIFMFFMFKRVKIGKAVQISFLISAVILFIGLSQFNFSIKYPAYFLQREYIYSLVFLMFIIGIKDLNFNNLVGRLFIKIGGYSFSMYLSHFFILESLAFVYKNILKLKFDNYLFIPFFAMTVLITLAIASVLYKIEEAGIRKGNLLIEKIKSRQLASA